MSNVGVAAAVWTVASRRASSHLSSRNVRRRRAKTPQKAGSPRDSSASPGPPGLPPKMGTILGPSTRTDRSHTRRSHTHGLVLPERHGGGQTSPCSRVPEEKTGLLGSSAPQGHAAGAGKVGCELQAPEPDSSVPGGCPCNNSQPPWCLGAGHLGGLSKRDPLSAPGKRVSLATGGVGESGEPALPLAPLVCYPTEGPAPGPRSGDTNSSASSSQTKPAGTLGEAEVAVSAEFQPTPARPYSD